MSLFYNALITIFAHLFIDFNLLFYPMKRVKIYGERNSGTIYLEWLLQNNLDIKMATTPDLGWKHRLAPVEDELTETVKKDIVFLCLVKNPYSWLLSMHKRPYHHEDLRKLSFTDFLRYSYGDYRNPIIMWNLKYQSYVKMQGFVENIQFIKYEDLLVDPKNMNWLYPLCLKT